MPDWLSRFLRSGQAWHGRLAPTPSGYLHAGNASAFIATWALARASGGTLRLRIDDIDKARCRDAYLDDIFQTLDWLGLDCDAGPSGVAEFKARHSQHLRLDRYAAFLAQLRDAPGLPLYACQASRKDLEARPGHWPYRERGLPLDTAGCSWRLAVDGALRWPVEDLAQGSALDVALAEALGDVVLRKKDGLPAYQIVSLVDDLDQGITGIVRGMDLLPSTAIQQYLAQAAGRADFGRIRCWHHALLRDAEGNKLSKSAGAAAVRTWREAGQPAAALVRAAATWLGLPQAERLECPADLLAALRDLRG